MDVPPPPIPTPAPIQREHDSLDDFEHLDNDHSPARMHREPSPTSVGDLISIHPDPPQQQEGDLLICPELMICPAKPPGPSDIDALQSFLDTEREEMDVVPPPHHHIPEDPTFSDSREELSPAPSDDSLPDAIENFMSPPSPAKAPMPAPIQPVIPPPREETPPPPPKTPEVKAPPTPPREETPPPPPKRVASQPPPIPQHQQQQQSPRPVMEAEAIFCQMGLDAWFNPGRLHPKVESLVYWRAPVRSGIALGAGLALLLALACCSLISVLAYTSLLALTATTTFRIYCCVLQAIQKTSDGHPFKEFLETDLSISPEKAQEMAVLATAHLNGAARELRRLFLVEDLVDSLKFGVSLWCLTYLGAWFNGMTLLIIGYVALFTLPKVYETNKAQIDANLDLVSAKFQEITNKVKAAIPIGKKGESEKDK